jgi:hypothetical protein
MMMTFSFGQAFEGSINNQYQITGQVTGYCTYDLIDDPQEQAGDPITYANGNQVGRSIPGIAFYHDFPPATYAFPVQRWSRRPSTESPIMHSAARITERTTAAAACSTKWLENRRDPLSLTGRISWRRPRPANME